jgi:hypothetical protein
VPITDAVPADEPPATQLSVPMIVEQSAPGIEVELAGGRRMRFERDADPETVRRLREAAHPTLPGALTVKTPIIHTGLS